MSGRNFERRRLLDRVRAERDTDPQDIVPGPRRDQTPLKGCRDCWDGDPFPVTVTRIPAQRDGKDLAA